MEIDVARAIGATTRTVRHFEKDGKPAQAVIASRTYDTDIDDLWDALTSRDRIPRWFAPVSGDLTLGGRYQIEGNAGGTITACDPPEKLALTWEFASTESWVDVRLRRVDDDTTHLELEHCTHIDPDWERRYGPGAGGVGWDLGLLGLQEHLATGAAIAPEADEAWTASENYKAFVSASSESWREAAIAAGTDREPATRAAANTTAFYLGETPPEA